MIDERQMCLPTYWDGRQDLTGWILTEKYDGVRAYWDGAQLWSRGGNVIHAPAELLAELPKGVAVDGEIWSGRGRFEDARLAVQARRWLGVEMVAAFDVPDAAGGYCERLAGLRDGLSVFPARPVVAQSNRHVADVLMKVVAGGGEGLIARHPTAPYQRGRTRLVLKVVNNG